jgi:hypothetical protein
VREGEEGVREGGRDLQKWAACSATRDMIHHGQVLWFPSKLVFYFHLNMGGDAKVSSPCYQTCIQPCI